MRVYYRALWTEHGIMPMWIDDESDAALLEVLQRTAAARQRLRPPPAPTAPEPAPSS